MTTGIAVVYDFLHVVGGAELFSLELARRLPQARLVVAGVASDFPTRLLPRDVVVLDTRPLPTTPARRALRAIQTFRQHRPLARSFRRIILSGHYAPLLHSPGQPGLYYGHTTPLPFLYEDRARTLVGASPLRHLGQALVGRWLRRQVRHTLGSGLPVLANSEFTATAFRQRLGVKAHVLHPPCAVELFEPRPSKGYFLSFARQEPGKQVDRIIQAFRQRPTQRLMVASDGSEHPRLRALAADCDNIEFVPTTDPQRIRALLSQCRASVYIPLNEPFGISAVESLACGKPVIGVRSGGLGEILRPATGWLIAEDAEVASLTRAMDQATETQCAQMQRACLDAARAYDWSQFMAQLTGWLAGFDAPASDHRIDMMR